MSYPRDPFCNAEHPDHTEQQEVRLPNGKTEIVERPSVHCRRLKGHDGVHSAFTYLISRPETWSSA